MELTIPAIKGIGGSLLYFVDRYGAKGSIWDVDFVWTGERDPKPEKGGLHLSRPPDPQRPSRPHGSLGRLVRKLFNFRDIRFFNIEGKLTGLISRAMTSPCGKIRIPINDRSTTSRRSRNTCANTRAKASSMSRWAAATSTRRSKLCAPTA